MSGSMKLERQYSAYVGLFAADLVSGRTLAHRADDPFAMCSTFKAYPAARVLQKAQRGELDLQQGVFIDPTALLPNSPMTAPQAGATMPLAQLCAAALERQRRRQSAVAGDRGTAGHHRIRSLYRR
jgi:beta-lactamase class A